MSKFNIVLGLDLPWNFGGRAQMKNINPLFLKKEVSNKIFAFFSAGVRGVMRYERQNRSR